jgi:hypothetical protein
MKHICDGPGGKAWFRIENEVEAERESELLGHAVAKHFRRERDKAAASYKPPTGNFIEQDIGHAAHLQRAMPLFLTLRDGDGAGLATAMLPPGSTSGGATGNGGSGGFRIIIVGPANADPYPEHEEAIETLAAHFALALPREDCFPYRR